MSNDTPATPPLPRETLTGDRLCMHCLHPLAGRTIERESSTGLLFVRCGECGSASALFDYPTATPWLNRMKSVAASTLAVLTILVVLALGGVCCGFSYGCVDFAVTASSKSLAIAFAKDGGSNMSSDGQYDEGAWAVVDEAWVASDAGVRALEASRHNPGVVIAILTLAPLGSIIAMPFAALLGIACMRRSLVSRALTSGGPALLATAVALMYAFANEEYGRAGLVTATRPTWVSLGQVHNSVYFTLVVGTWFFVFSALVGLVAPACIARLFQFILPPRERNLVAWLWEWRGKPVPKT